MEKNEQIETILSNCVSLNNPMAAPALSYLNGRGLDALKHDDQLFFHPRLDYFEEVDGKIQKTGEHPAIVAKVTNIEASNFAIHRIYLSVGGGKALVTEPKKALGPITGGGIWFGEPTDKICVAEGIETSLAIFQGTGTPTVAAISATGMEKIVLPKTVKEVFIFGDLDISGRGQKAAKVLAKTLHATNIVVHVILPLGPVPEEKKSVDWLDVFNQSGATALQDAIKNSQPWKPLHKIARKFVLTSLGELLKQPEETVPWLVNNLLPLAGISILAGKPKAGKTTVARQLALAIAWGLDFMGRISVSGPVIYLALEEKKSEVIKHFSQMGATGDENILIHVASAPEDALNQLWDLIDQHRPLLVIIDPLFRFTKVESANDYTEVTNALESIVELSRTTGAHIMVVHHLGKSDRQGGDGILGSTAIFAAVDTAILLNANENYRSIKSIQRYGVDIEESVLNFDAKSRTVTLGGHKAEVAGNKMQEAILKYLDKQKTPAVESEIQSGVTGNKGLKVRALRELVGEGKVKRDGEGGRKDPFRYSVNSSCSDVPTYSEEQENNNQNTHPSPENNGINSYSNQEVQ